MTEMDKLAKYLEEHGIEHSRRPMLMENGEQIVVTENGKRKWDVICNDYSYGGSAGLLEAMGKPIVKKTDPEGELGVIGWLTAQDVIARLEESK